MNRINKPVVVMYGLLGIANHVHSKENKPAGEGEVGG